MENICQRCGKCCQAIVLHYSLEEVKRVTDTNVDKQFILDNWEEITKEEAFTLNPYLATKRISDSNFYRCKQYNVDTKLCKAHEIKSNICENYPFYGKNTLPLNFAFYAEDCAYNKEEFKELQK